MSRPLEPERMLTELGRAEMPPADDLFVDRLDDRLRARMELQWRDEVEARRPWWGAIPRPATGYRWVAAAVAVVLALSLGIVGDALRPGGSDGRGGEGKVAARDGAVLTFAEARNVSVLLPDGSVAQARAGDEIADGALVRVGDGGLAVIGEHRLGPGGQARVERGNVVVLTAADPAAGSATTTTP